MPEQNQNKKIRKIIHVDMDAFYASVEQRDAPHLKGKPVIVGGPPNSRGVVAACSYEARKYGIHSAMPSSRAYRLCPQAVFLKARFDVYRDVSRQIRQIFHQYTDLIEPLSLDEAYLDVTENKKGIRYAADIAREILKQIHRETNLTASAGVSFNKFLAKVASDYNKPNGMTVITPKMAAQFIDRLPIRKFHGVGKVTEQKMLGLGIKTGADLKKFSKEELLNLFGKVGNYYYNIAHALDDRPVNPTRERKSMGQERTFSRDIDDREEMLEFLEQMAGNIEGYLKKHDLLGRTVTLKVKYYDFKSITRSFTPGEPLRQAAEIMKYVERLLQRTAAGEKKVRLLGISISNFTTEEHNRHLASIPGRREK
ncbi:MAG: DNA polymerase IV [Candidatus Aminicenantes bacterium]|nr:DNA polymerase IV [Candidatus Aminicenantes bacterium]